MEQTNIGDVKEYDIEELVNEVVSGADSKYLNTKSIKDNGIRKAQVLSVGAAYKKAFREGDEPKPMIDLEVKVLTPGPLVDKTLVYTLSKQNIIRMHQAFGKSDQWGGKLIRFIMAKSNKGNDMVLVEAD